MERRHRRYVKIHGVRRTTDQHRAIDGDTDFADNESASVPAGCGDNHRNAVKTGSTFYAVMPDTNDPSLAVNTTESSNLFGGSHTGGITALCDGSSRLVGFEMDPIGFSRLCIRNDGQNFILD